MLATVPLARLAPLSMNRRLFQLNVRRGLSPFLGGALILIALFIHVGADLPASVGLGSEHAGALLRGLRRTDQWVGLLLVLLPAAILQATHIWRRLEQRERLWLISSPISRASVCLSTWAGAWGASLLWLLLASGLCEWSANRADAGVEWRRQGTLEMHDVQRAGVEGNLHWTSPIDASEQNGRARFSVGLYGLDNQAEQFELRSFASDGTLFDQVTVQPALHSTLEVSVPAAGGDVAFEFRARGAQRSLLLNRPRFDLFVPTARFNPTLFLMGRVLLLLAVVQALVLGLGAWFSAPTALLYVVGSYVLVWLEGERLAGTWIEAWIPALDLPAALGWIAAGRGPSGVPWQSVAGACLLVGLGLGLLHARLGRWRPGR